MKNLAHLLAHLLIALSLAALAVPALCPLPAFAQSTLSGQRIQPGTLPVTKIQATGTAGSTTFLRGDGSWAAASGASDHQVILSGSDTAPGYLDAKTGVNAPLTISDISGVRVIGMGAAGAGVSGYLLGSDWNTFSAKEPGLGNPSASGYVLSSTAAGVRSWIAPPSGGSGGGLSVSESVGSGSDVSLTTTYATIPNISIAVAANQAVNVDGLVEMTADAATGLDDLYCQLYDTVAAAAVANSERHISYLPAGKRGLVTVEKYVAGAAAGRTLVLQAKNATAARGTVSLAKSLLQALSVTSGTSTGSGTSIVKPANGTLLKSSGTTLTSGLVFLTPLYEGSGTTVQDLVTGSTATIPSGWAWGTAAEGTVLTNTGTSIGPQFTGITPIVGDDTVLVIATPAAGQAGNYGTTTYFGEQGGGTWTTALDSRGWNSCGSSSALAFTATPPSGTEYYVATRSSSSGNQTVYSLSGQAVATLGSATSSAGNGSSTSTVRVVGGGVVSRYTSGNIVFIAQWNRVLTTAEIAQLATDPYSMFVGH